MKKNIAILMIIPFLLSILSILIVQATFPILDVDISRIEWEYDDYECYSLKNDRYRLNAQGFTFNNGTLAPGNELVWTAENVTSGETPHAQILREGDSFYLVPLSEGEVYVTCSNEKGNVSRRMVVLIYLNNVIAVQMSVPSSQSNIDPFLYVGTHDIKNGKKVGACLDFEVKTVPLSLFDETKVTDYSENISVDLSTKKVSVLSAGDAYFTLTATDGTTRTFAFRAVDGVNVYTYDDLLYCTNRSQTGECMVLRKSFESLENTYSQNANGQYDLSAPTAKNIACFGNYDAKTQRYSFEKEVYTFRTTGNTRYLEQWNEFAANNTRYNEIPPQIVVGLRVQKDIYGNGFTINFHNLTYPYLSIDKKINGVVVNVPFLDDDNLFRGPLPYYAFGNPEKMPLATIYGQDNVGMYVDGDNITVNDLKLKGCNEVKSLSFLNTVGTVLEAHGRNITVQNSILSLGRNVVRVFSSDVTVKNCILSDASNFLFHTSADEYAPIDKEKVYSLLSANGSVEKQTLWTYLQAGAKGDRGLESFIIGAKTSDWTKLTAFFRSISDALNDDSALDHRFAGESVIDGCLFYRSGITAIGVESISNGPYLLTGQSPSKVVSMLRELGFMPCIISDVGGISRPVKVTVKGNTKFFDYKSEDDFVIEGLIGENISSLAATGLIKDPITFDHVFPIRSFAINIALKANYAQNWNGKQMFNPIVTKYGGGLNLSSVSLENSRYYSDETAIDLLDSFAAENADDLQSISEVAKRLILIVIGGEPFRIRFCTDASLLGNVPSVSTLRENVATLASNEV